MAKRDDVPGTDLILVDPATAVERVVLPLSGAVVGEDATMSEFEAALVEFAELEKAIAAARVRISQWVRARMDAGAKWTHGRMSTASPSTLVTWDEAGLVAELDRLVAEGKVTAEARAACLKVSTKVMLGGVNALLKVGGEVEQRLVQHRGAKPDRRTVTLK